MNGCMSMNYHLKKCGGDMDKAIQSRHERIMKIVESNSGKRRRSKKEDKFFEDVKQALPNIELDQSKMVQCNGNKLTYFVDILIEDRKVIIEYFDDYWHANPSKYDDEYFNKSKNKTASEIWQIDAQRVNSIKELGYNVIIVWEK